MKHNFCIFIIYGTYYESITLRRHLYLNTYFTFHLINTRPIELKLSEFECPCKMKAGTDFKLFSDGIFPRYGSHL